MRAVDIGQEQIDRPFLSENHPCRTILPPAPRRHRRFFTLLEPISPGKIDRTFWKEIPAAFKVASVSLPSRQNSMKITPFLGPPTDRPTKRRPTGPALARSASSPRRKIGLK